MAKKNKNIKKSLSKRDKINMLVKASGQAIREEAIKNGGGFKSTHKVHKSKKTYTRKSKHKKNYL